MQRAIVTIVGLTLFSTFTSCENNKVGGKKELIFISPGKEERYDVPPFFDDKSFIHFSKSLNSDSLQDRFMSMFSTTLTQYPTVSVLLYKDGSEEYLIRFKNEQEVFMGEIAPQSSKEILRLIQYLRNNTNSIRSVPTSEKCGIGDCCNPDGTIWKP